MALHEQRLEHIIIGLCCFETMKHRMQLSLHFFTKYLLCLQRCNNAKPVNIFLNRWATIIFMVIIYDIPSIASSYMVLQNCCVVNVILYIQQTTSDDILLLCSYSDISPNLIRQTQMQWHDYLLYDCRCIALQMLAVGVMSAPQHSTDGQCQQ